MSQQEKTETETTFRWLVGLTLRQARRLVIGITGVTVLGVGILMIVTPGPAMVVIPAGLAILAAEFVWARRMLRRIRVQSRWQLRKVRNRYRQSRALATAANTEPVKADAEPIETGCDQPEH